MRRSPPTKKAAASSRVRTAAARTGSSSMNRPTRLSDPARACRCRCRDVRAPPGRHGPTRRCSSRTAPCPARGAAPRSLPCRAMPGLELT
jgi:hypothetical protein